MLAVLPFENLTGDPKQKYFSEGFTEELITQLGGLDPAHLGVIARTSVVRFENSAENTREIGHELAVGFILEGSVRREDGRVRISVQLIRLDDRTQLWAESYQRPLLHTLGVQQSVSREIARAVGERLALKKHAGLNP